MLYRLHFVCYLHMIYMFSASQEEYNQGNKRTRRRCFVNEMMPARRKNQPLFYDDNSHPFLSVSVSNVSGPPPSVMYKY
jgi:hypothetical protein